MSNETFSIKKGLPGIFEKLVAWALIGLVSVLIATEVAKYRVSALESAFKSHQEVQRDDARNQITRPEFNQFKEDLYRRLDQDHQDFVRRFEKLDEKLEKRAK